MNLTRRLRWHVAVPVFAALAALAAAALPAAAQAAGPPGQGAGPKVPAFRGFAGRAAGSAAAAPVLPMPGDTPAVAGANTAEVPLYVGYTGVDHHAYEVPMSSPAAEVSLSGSLIGGPGQVFVPASIGGPGIAGPFARASDNALWWYTTSWHRLGGTLTSRPGVAAGPLSVSGGGAIDIVVRGSSGAVFDTEATATGGRGFISLGGRTLAGSGPAAVNVGGTVYVLAIGTSGAVFVNRSTDGAHWSGWHTLGGRANGDVGVATPARGVAVAFVRGAGNAVWYNEFVGTTPGISRGWHSLGGSPTSGVGAGSAQNGSMWVVVLAPDGHIWKRTGTWPKLANWTKLF